MTDEDSPMRGSRRWTRRWPGTRSRGGTRPGGARGARRPGPRDDGRAPGAGDAAPIGRDAIFRIASLTKPVTGAAAMLLVQDGAMALGDPVERWLPELGGRRVLRSYDAECPTRCPRRGRSRCEDVLSFRLGFGCIFTPQALPVIKAEADARAQDARPAVAADAAHARSVDRRARPPPAARPAGRTSGGTTRARPSPGSSSSG